MNSYSAVFELNSGVSDRTVALFYFGRRILDLISKKAGGGELNCKIITSLLKKNDGQYWIELRSSLPEGGEQYTPKESDLVFAFCISVPPSLELTGIHKVNYYDKHCNSIGKRIGSGDEGVILLSRVVFNSRKKHSLEVGLVSSSMFGDGESVQGFGFGDNKSSVKMRIENHETIHMDMENNVLCQYVNSNTRLLNGTTFSIHCRKCENLISKFTETCVVAPLPSEMMLNGSEVLSCDNCSPLLSKDSTTNHYSFFARHNWICLGHYHISLNSKNVSGVVKRPFIFSNKDVVGFFVRDMNDIYYDGTENSCVVTCSKCESALGWVNDSDTSYNFWKYSIFLSVYLGSDQIEDGDLPKYATTTLFTNHSPLSLFSYYIDKYTRQGSSLSLVNENDPTERVNLHIIKKNSLKVKFSNTLYMEEHIPAKDSHKETSDTSRYMCLDTHKSRFTFYNEFLFSYKMNSNNNIIDGSHLRTGEGNQGTEYHETLYIDGTKYGHLKDHILGNTLFCNHSSLSIPVFSDDSIF